MGKTPELLYHLNWQWFMHHFTPPHSQCSMIDMSLMETNLRSNPSTFSFVLEVVEVQTLRLMSLLKLC